ncbi:hypothetical protein Taro_047370, partial [Colocasia esculenta]|nr:hypothetical protein [Colocasia esculenta]
VGIENADFGVDITNADTTVGIENVDSKVGIVNADTKVGIENAEFGVGILNADTLLKDPPGRNPFTLMRRNPFLTAALLAVPPQLSRRAAPALSPHYNPWSIGYGGGSSQYLFMPITDHSHTFHSASSSGHHVIEEHVIDEDEEDKIDSQDDIDDNEDIEDEDDEPLSDIVRVNNTEIKYEQDPPDVFTSDQWIDEAIMNNSHEGIDVPCTLEGEEPHVGQIFTNKKNLIY